MRLLTTAAQGVLCSVVALLTGCIPYVVGHTAKPAREGERQITQNLYLIPNGLGLSESSTRANQIGSDIELRTGVSDRADVGIRLTSFSGGVLNYMRRLNGVTDERGTAVSVMVGGGIVNLGQHAEFEATMLASGDDNSSFTPFGGARIVQVAPLATGAVHDTPTAGGFIGFRLGTMDFGLSPELGIYYDKSAIGNRKSNVLFVPSVSVHGDLLRFLTGRR